MARKPPQKKPAKKRSSATKARKPSAKAKEAKSVGAKAKKAKPTVPAAKRPTPAVKPVAAVAPQPTTPALKPPLAVAPVARGPVGATSSLPAGDQVQAEVNSALTDAIKTRLNLEITGTTVPNDDPFRFDEGGWMLILENFAVELRKLRPVYDYYEPLPIYAKETLTKEFDAIVMYLTTKVIAQFPDGEEKQ